MCIGNRYYREADGGSITSAGGARRDARGTQVVGACGTPVACGALPAACGIPCGRACGVQRGRGASMRGSLSQPPPDRRTRT